MSDDARQQWIEGRADTMSALEQSFEAPLEVDEDSMIPDEGQPYQPGEFGPAAPEAPPVAAAPEVTIEAPVEAAPPPAPEAPKPPEAPSAFEQFMAWQKQQEAAKVEQAEQAQRQAVEAQAAQQKALRDNPKWRAQLLTQNGMDPKDPIHQAYLDQAFRQQDLEDQIRAVTMAMTDMQGSLREGRALAVAQSEVSRVASEIKAPPAVVQLITERVHDLVIAGWSERDAVEYVAAPFRAWTPATPPTPAAAPAPKPGPKILTPEERRALSVSSLQGRGAGKANLPTDPAARLALARGMISRRS
jgi:hypothetical protein